MKVFIITGSLNQGGAEFQSIELARLFRDYGHEVTILALTDYDFYSKYVKQNNLHYNALQNSTPRIIRVFQAWLYVMKYQPDIMISYTRIVSRVAILIRKYSLKKFVLLISERTSKTDIKKDPRYFKLAEGSDILTTNSITKFEYIKKTYPHLISKLHFMPNLLQTDTIAKKPLIRGDEGFIRYLYAGRLSPEKNVIAMIEAFNTLNKNGAWSLDIYGASQNSSYYALVRKKIDSCGLGQKILLKGVNELNQIYCKYDFLCLFSEYEGFSNVISEAITAGLPVLCSGIPENAFLIKNYVNGLLSTGTDPKSISYVINKSMTLSVEERNNMSFNNLNKSASLFERERMYRKYIEIITKVIEK